MKTPKEFDYDLWTTGGGECFVRVKATGDTTAVSVEVMRTLRPSLVMLEQITTIDKSRVKKYIGRLRREKMREIDDAIEISLGLRIPKETPAP